jgi:hypothetical protein
MLMTRKLQTLIGAVAVLLALVLAPVQARADIITLVDRNSVVNVDTTGQNGVPGM